MSDKSKSRSEEFGRILDGLAEYIQNAPGNELLEDARQDGRAPAQTSSRVKGLLRQAVTTHKERLLKKAEEEYEREVSVLKSRPVVLPKSPERRRTMLAAVFSRQPQLRAAFTFQNRGFSELTDDDIESHLRKLALLGVLEDIKLPETDD
jgi:hypothetical protein